MASSEEILLISDITYSGWIWSILPLSSVYAVPSVRSEVTNIGRYLPAGSVDDFKENAFQYFSESQSVSSFSVEEKEAVNRLRSEKYIREEWICNR